MICTRNIRACIFEYDVQERARVRMWSLFRHNHSMKTKCICSFILLSIAFTSILNECFKSTLNVTISVTDFKFYTNENILVRSEEPYNLGQVNKENINTVWKLK